MDSTAATRYLAQYIGKTLRVYIEDGRMFAGQMKCTDKDQNLIIGTTYEYRSPTPQQAKSVLEDLGSSTAKVPMSSRFVGLVVVPGQYITKIECEGEIPNIDDYIKQSEQSSPQDKIESLTATEPSTMEGEA